MMLFTLSVRRVEKLSLQMTKSGSEKIRHLFLSQCRSDYVATFGEEIYIQPAELVFFFQTENHGYGKHGLSQ